MKHVIWPIALLLTLLAANAVVASTPGTIWFEDGFEDYIVGTALRSCTTNWEDGFNGQGPQNLIQNELGGGYNDSQKYVLLKGSSGSGLKSVAQTKYNWADMTAGRVQILHFRVRVGSTVVTPHDHAGVYVLDANNSVIMGWSGGTGAYGMKTKTSLTGSEGKRWAPWPAGDTSYHEFDCVYNPDTGVVEYYVDGSSTPLNTLNAGVGRAGNKVYVRDEFGNNSDDFLYLDDLKFGTNALATVTAPVGGAFLATTTPTVTWTHAQPSGMTAYRVKVCTSDNLAGTAVYDSGQVDASAASIVTTALPPNQHLWAFVNEQYGSSWSGWSLIGNGGFYCTPEVPAAPVVSSPSGTVVGVKPTVTFTSDLHNKLQAKITTAPNSSAAAVWDSGELNTTLNGASCNVLLTAGTQYYAFAKVCNAAGWSGWSAPSAFQVTRDGEAVDIRHFDEKWDLGGGVFEDILHHDAPAPNDGFKVEVQPMNFSWITMTLPTGQCNGGNTYWSIEDGQPIKESETMRLHKIADLSLDKGVTFVTAMRIPGEGGDYIARTTMQQSNIYVVDDYGAGKCMAAFRTFQGQMGVCTDGLTWVTKDYNYDETSDDWRIIRITGRNTVAGDPSSTVWKLYLNEDPVAAVTGSGSADRTLVGSPGWMTDGIVIGQGCYGLWGTFQYDWTAVNTAGDYAPGEWAPMVGTFDTVSAARAGGETKTVTITGEAVITAIRYDGWAPIGFWVQDVSSVDRGNILIESTEETNIAVGNKVTGISGTLGRVDGVGPVLKNATFTATANTAEALPLAMIQKSMTQGGCVDQFGQGTESTGVFVRIVGRVTAKVDDLVTGGTIYYVDDGSGLIDGRNVADGLDATTTGIRILVLDPIPVVATDYVRIDGIAGYDIWTDMSGEEPVDKGVRSIQSPTITKIDEAP